MTNEKTVDGLLPCPFCGAVGLDFAEGSTFRWRVASCVGCCASAGEERIQTTGAGTREEWEDNCRARMIEAWNRRATALAGDAGLAQDAARYRWLRECSAPTMDPGDNFKPFCAEVGRDGLGNNLLYGADLDEAIDEAMNTADPSRPSTSSALPPAAK